jgi:hypothetical protein
MNDILVAAEAWTPPFFFHYIIVILCLAFIMCVAVLKFKYLYWYSQPLTFRFTLRRFGGGERQHTSIMNPLSLGERCYNAVVYPFLNYVNHADVRVSSADATDNNHVLRFERIAAFLSRPETQIITHHRRIRENVYIEGGCIPSDTLRIILSQHTFGLSPFIGLLYGATQPRPVDDGGSPPTPTPIKGVSIITPRIMTSWSASGRSVSIYMCDYLAWERYTVSDRQSLELLETTEYIQKSREIAGEQTLYRYREIPWFVIPFTTVYTYTFRMATAATAAVLGNGMSVVRVSSVNMAVFYSFVNECSRDFRCCIFNELTQLQSLVTHGIYHIYMLLFNDVRVIAAYIFAPSWTVAAKVSKTAFSENTATTRTATRTKSNRISNLHKYISTTSTALVKYIPPVITPQYDAFGKRIPREKKEGTGESAGSGTGRHRNDDDVLLLMSSIQHSALCDKHDFVAGFQYAAAYHHTKTNLIMIDTLAHNYRLIDYLAESRNPIPAAWKLLSRDKWYYILYNAIIHESTLCKDILMI